MIGHHHDERVVEAAIGPKRRQEPAHLRIGVGDLGVVGAVARGRECRGDFGGRVIRRVCVVQMHPGEEGRRGGFAKPRGGRVDHHGASPLNGIESGADVFGQVEVVEVVVESLRDAPTPVEHERANEPSGAIAAPLEHFGERGDRVVHVEAGVVAHPVRRGPRASEEARVGRERERRGGSGRGETSAARGQRVEHRGLCRRIAVAADVVGAQGVEGDDEHIRRTASGASAAAQASQTHEQRRQTTARCPEAGKRHQRIVPSARLLAAVPS